MTNVGSLSHGRRGGWLTAPAVLLLAVMGLTGCAGSASQGPTPNVTDEQTASEESGSCLNQAFYEIVMEEFTAEEFLDRVHEDDRQTAGALFYPEEHPHAGEFVPWQEWEREQRRAWGVFITRPWQMSDLFEMLFLRLTAELTPEEYAAQLGEDGREVMDNLVYPADHPDAGEFVEPEDLRISWAWERYLIDQPAGPGCPW